MYWKCGRKIFHNKKELDNYLEETFDVNGDYLYDAVHDYWSAAEIFQNSTKEFQEKLKRIAKQ